MFKKPIVLSALFLASTSAFATNDKVVCTQKTPNWLKPANNYVAMDVGTTLLIDLKSKTAYWGSTGSINNLEGVEKDGKIYAKYIRSTGNSSAEKIKNLDTSKKERTAQTLIRHEFTVVSSSGDEGDVYVTLIENNAGVVTKGHGAWIDDGESIEFAYCDYFNPRN